jgi:hypothetical protein
MLGGLFITWKSACDKSRHDFIGVMNALGSPLAQGAGQRRGEARRELVAFAL